MTALPSQPSRGDSGIPFEGETPLGDSSRLPPEVGHLGRLSRWTPRQRELAFLLAAVFFFLVVGLAEMSALWISERQARFDATDEQILAERRVEKLLEAANHHNRANTHLNRANTHLDRGRVCLTLRNYRSAREELDRAIAERSDFPAAWRERGFLYAQLYLWKEGAQDLKMAFQIQEPAHATPWRQLALLHAACKDTAGQARIASHMLTHFAKQANPINASEVVRACTLCDPPVGDESAWLAMAKIGESDRYSSWTPTHTGLVLLAANRPGEAISRFQEALDRGGSWSVTRPALALALARAGRQTEAIAALDLAKQDADTWFRDRGQTPDGFLPIAWADWVEFDLVLRRAHLNIRQTELPEESRLASLRGRAYQILGQVNDARLEFDQAVANRPADPQARLERGRFRHQQGDLAGSEPDFKMGLAFGRGDRNFLQVAVRAMAELESWPMVDTAAFQLAQLDHTPVDVPLLREAAEVAVQGKRWDAAARLFERASQANRHDATLFARLGDCRFRQGDPAGSRDALAKAVELDPTNARYRDASGHAYAECAEWDRAAQQFAEAARLLPLWPQPRHHLALTKLAKGDRQGFQTELASIFDHTIAHIEPAEATALLYLALSVPNSLANAQLKSLLDATDARSLEHHRLQMAVLFRCGNVDHAARGFDIYLAAGGVPNSWDLMFQALILLARKDEKGARAAHAKALALMEEASRPGNRSAHQVSWTDWGDRVEVMQLRHEVEALLAAVP